MTEQSTPRPLKPFLKWPGGKHRMAERLAALLPEFPGRFDLTVPFLGAGGFSLYVMPRVRVFLGADILPWSVGLFNMVKRMSGAADIRAMARYFTPEANTKEIYYERRDLFNHFRTPHDTKLHLFLYLNRHCYNGLVRFNQKGEFNAPFGRYKQVHFPRQALQRWRLERDGAQQQHFLTQDFRTTMEHLARRPPAGVPSVVYCDPPYYATFSSYSGQPFTEKDHRDLNQMARRAANRGHFVMVSNSLSSLTTDLYSDCSRSRYIGSTRSISRRAGDRGKMREIVYIYEND